jgi:enoyl-CoA hydratase/carnithine racemase
MERRAKGSLFVEGRAAAADRSTGHALQRRQRAHLSFAALPPLAARLVKESLQHGLDIPNLADAALVDLYRFMALEATEDKDEGHRARREKRRPVFRGR